MLDLQDELRALGLPTWDDHVIALARHEAKRLAEHAAWARANPESNRNWRKSEKGQAAQKRAYEKRKDCPKHVAYQKAYRARPDVKAKRAAHAREVRASKVRARQRKLFVSMVGHQGKGDT